MFKKKDIGALVIGAVYGLLIAATSMTIAHMITAVVVSVGFYSSTVANFAKTYIFNSHLWLPALTIAAMPPSAFIFRTLEKRGIPRRKILYYGFIAVIIVGAIVLTASYLAACSACKYLLCDGAIKSCSVPWISGPYCTCKQ